jgi:hypothetical protein
MKEEIYISIKPEIYRENKSNILLAQAEFLHSMKRVQNLRILAKQRLELKSELHKFISSILAQVKKLEEKLPNPKIPKELQHKEIKKSISKKKKIDPKSMEIDEEIQFINQKLHQLNS